MAGGICGGNLFMKILVQVIVDQENGNPAVIQPIRRPFKNGGWELGY